MSTLISIKPFEISTHNGVITVKSRATGDHRTIRVRTQPKESRFAPGKRVVQLLTGPDNTSDYTSFGFVQADGNVFLFRKHQDSEIYVWLRRFLMHPERFAAKVAINFEGHCRRCNRVLTTPESVLRGTGDRCNQYED